MPKIIFANWKNRIGTETDAIKLALATDAKGIVVCPPHPFLNEIAETIQNAELATQDYTPDAFARGARYALIGHADRRAAGDTDAIVAEKFALAVSDGLIPVLCIGESRAERDSGMTHGVLKRQIVSAFTRLINLTRLASESERESVILNQSVYIAYEPLWAISTGKNAEVCSPEAAVARIAFIKEQLLHLRYGVSAQYLYGGSVTSKNAARFLQENDIDGLLIGAASVNLKELKKIGRLASKS